MTSKSKKSLTNLPKHTSKGSIVNEKKERGSTTTRERRSTAQSIEESFDLQFKKFCAQFKSWIIPNVIIVPREPLPGDFPLIASQTSQEEMHVNISKKIEQSRACESKVLHDASQIVPKVLTVFDNYDTTTFLNAVLFKHFIVDRSMLISLRKSLQKFDTVVTLKLEFCQLENTHLRTLKTILQKNDSITDLSISGNPNRFQNFYILLKDTKLLHISMCYCQINDRGMHLIALQLSSSDQSLMSLNLSSNFISDEGAISVANALRINRNLLFLNLADNWLADNGCAALMDILRIFTLKHEEIVVRRHRITNYLIKKTDMIKSQQLKAKQELDNQTVQSHSKKSVRSLSKMGKEINTRKSSKGSASSIHSKSVTTSQSKKSLEVDMQLIERMVELELGKDNHPFVKDSYTENMEIYCKGNLKLMYLNLAYNKIGLSGLQEIIETLRYQQIAAVNMQEGLSNIILEGNLAPEYCEEINYIFEIMKESRSKRSSDASHESRRSSRRKRSGSARVSINL